MSPPLFQSAEKVKLAALLSSSSACDAGAATAVAVKVVGTWPGETSSQRPAVELQAAIKGMAGKPS